MIKHIKTHVQIMYFDLQNKFINHFS